MTKTSPATEHAAARAFNDYHPLGTPVRYWKGAREGDGKVSRTRTEAQLLSGHTAVIWLENVSGCIALTHIQPISEDEFAATPAEQWPAAATGRSFAAYLTAQERDQLDARAATAEQERDEARDDRDVLRQQLDTARAELGAAQELLAVVDDLAEQLDRARARYATRPEVTPVEPEPRHPGDALADDLRNAYSTEQLANLHEDLAHQLDDDAPREDPLGRLVDALFAARWHQQPGLGSAPPRAQDDEATPRRLLDQAIESALPQAGGNVRALLKALRRELKRVDVKRAEHAEREG